jgi:hypothetical protein
MKSFFKLLTLTIVTLALVIIIDYTFLEAQESQGVSQSTSDLQFDPNEGPLAQSPSAQADDGPPQPVIVMPEVEFLAGEVDPSSTISHEFLVKNEGPGDLMINKVVPGCGFSVASFTSFIPREPRARFI